ncbi:hypothetical protein PFISCL1PPCAC_7868 [Pristionchus fissidentatus]|uniref:Uncharacterized protein n=1 Tax=Pristionchus fissidentatus TaxID=1538716 RepID=A0AAV5VB21_9BILA|nr:hypothetical protein PFISCL1PPCAC_7868 [Pristionchus fissidentatus]
MPRSPLISTVCSRLARPIGMNILRKAPFFSKKAPESKEEVADDARSPAGSDYARSPKSSRSEIGTVRQQCDIFSITNDPATEFEEAPAPVPPSVRLVWRLIAGLSLVHAILLLVNVVLLFNVDSKERRSHQQVLLFSLLMLTNIVLVIVMALVVIRQNKSITQCAICCCFWTAFAYFVILAYNSLDDPLSLCAGRTCLAVIILTLVELGTLAAYFVLRFIRYKKVVELYNCRACTCNKECGGSKTPTKLGVYDLWRNSEENTQPPTEHRRASSAVGSITRESPLSEPQFNLPSTHYM